MSLEAIRSYLLNKQLIRDDRADIVPLQGGVSSEIYLVRETGKALVVKKALAKLKVTADWYADVSRNASEQAYIAYVHGFLPGVVPELLYSDPVEGLFAMEYLGNGFVNWKTQLLKKEVAFQNTLDAARVLGTIHRHSWNDPNARDLFDTNRNFFELRLEPYLLATGKKHPDLNSFFEKESERLSNTHQCLVHGDFSPKNILLGEGRLVLLDCEVAWYGDPAFDAAFFLNHFLLKSLHFAPADAEPFIAQVLPFRDHYQETLGPVFREHQLDQRISRLLPMLLLARVDGKSPVEYLIDEAKKNFIRTFTATIIPEQVNNLDLFISLWKDKLRDFATTPSNFK